MHKPLFITAFLGLLVSGYLFIVYTSPIPIICGEDGGCHVVQASQYAQFFGLPTPAYGLLFYAFLAALASLWPQKSPLYTFTLYFTTLTGLLVSGFLTYLEAFVVEAWCFWCVISAILATIAFLLIWLHPKRQPITPNLEQLS